MRAKEDPYPQSIRALDTALTQIDSPLQNLLDKIDDQECRQWLESIRQNIGKMGQIIDTLMIVGHKRAEYTAHCPLPTAHCPLPTAHCPLH